MRDIKFRAYDKFEKRMYKIENITWNCFREITNIGVFENDSLCKSYTKNHNVERHNILALELMQYTGLHDKNRKEIYEGDIVYCQTKFGKAKAIIKFIDGKFVAYWDSILTHPQNGHCIACYEINKRFEVIENIYDNPELLGGE